VKGGFAVYLYVSTLLLICDVLLSFSTAVDAKRIPKTNPVTPRSSQTALTACSNSWS
jgi:hypothetical protein